MIGDYVSCSPSAKERWEKDGIFNLNNLSVSTEERNIGTLGREATQAIVARSKSNKKCILGSIDANSLQYTAQ